MKLSIVDRIIIEQSVLPPTGTINDIKKIISIKDKIKFTEEEQSSFNISIPSAGMIQINNVTEDMKARSIDYDFTEDEIKLLSECASIQDISGWVTPSSLETIDMLIQATKANDELLKNEADSADKIRN